jgi:hypothetical protein
MGDELRRSDLEREFPGWQFTVGVDRLPHARRPRTSPPVWLAGWLVVGLVRGLVWAAGEIAGGIEARRRAKLRELV